ncbi:hypothetical protein ABZ949_26095 [Micromonospora tulbaghiae]|uniref:hypothetical protein n=1 Tax=Micromonospora tulbaghiae TaxID=479978 RepID=UPI0033CFEDF0
MPSQDQIREDAQRRVAFLSALYDRERDGQSPHLGQLAEDLGLDPNDPSIHRLSKDLRDANLIAGTGVFGGGIPRPRLTEAGKQTVMRSLAPADAVNPSRGSTNATISGITMGDGNTVSFMQNSPGGSQETTLMPFMQRRVLAWLDDVDKRAPKHHFTSSQDLADIQELSAELRTEVNGEARQGRVRELTQHIVGILSAASASLVSNGLVEAGQALLQHLG